MGEIGINNSRRILQMDGREGIGGSYWGKRAETNMGRRIAVGPIRQLLGVGAVWDLIGRDSGN